MVFRLDTLHEKAWFKSLAALTAFMVSAAGLYSALSPYLHRHDAATAQGKTVVAPAAPASLAASGPRTIDDGLKRQIAESLKDRNVPVTIVCVRGDDEAGKFAKQIASYLRDQGYHDANITFTSFPPSFHGVDFDRGNNRMFIKVGHQ